MINNIVMWITDLKNQLYNIPIFYNFNWIQIILQ